MKKRMRQALADREPPAPARAGADAWPLSGPFRVGGVEIPNRVVQAPLAGIANWPFRLQAQRHGAGLAVSEMIASMGVAHGNQRTVDMLEVDPREGLTAIQVFGASPEAMASAAEAAEAAGACMVDINMGCPVHKVCKTGAGSSLLGDPELAERVVAAMVDAVSIPVTVKMRRGLTPDEARPVDFARRMEDAGASAIAFHPRAAAEEYRGQADHTITTRVVEAVDIPVVASGDITTAERARAVHEETGCAAVMIGRAALGNPWIFHAMATGEPSRRPALDGVIEELCSFALDQRRVLGDRRAMHVLRKFYPWYLAGEPVDQGTVADLLRIDDLDTVLDRLRGLATGDPLATVPGLN